MDTASITIQDRNRANPGAFVVLEAAFRKDLVGETAEQHALRVAQDGLAGHEMTADEVVAGVVEVTDTPIGRIYRRTFHVTAF